MIQLLHRKSHSATVKPEYKSADFRNSAEDLIPLSNAGVVDI